MSKTTRKKRVVVIGGGTGIFPVLRGLKKYPVHLSAIVTMMDSGGSTGVLRNELGVLPPGDVRQALIALSGSSSLLQELFSYRYANGCLEGHNFGNIFIASLEKVAGNFEKALDMVGKILNIKGEVIPVTTRQATLCVKLANGRQVCGEHKIDEPQHDGKIKIKQAYLKSPVSATPRALAAIKKADLIIIGPGDLYTSLIPNLLVSGVSQAIKKSKAKLMFICNLMTKYGQTNNFTAKDFTETIEKYSGRRLDYVLVNNKRPTSSVLKKYAKHKEYPVLFDKKVFPNIAEKAIIGNFLSNKVYKKKEGDKLIRSLARHDGERAARQIVKLLN